MIGYRHLAAAGVLVLGLSACGAATSMGKASGNQHASAGQHSPMTRLDAVAKRERAGTLHGTFVAVGGPAPGGTYKSDGTVEVLSGTRVMAVLRTSGGAFTTRLSAGSYTLTGRRYGAPCRTTHIIISAGKTATTQVVCDVP
jgi:hypothetical protein